MKIILLFSLVFANLMSLSVAIGPSQRYKSWGTATSLGKKMVYTFPEGNANEKKLLGNKGANLCEMANLGLPVPPGFVITQNTRLF